MILGEALPDKAPNCHFKSQMITTVRLSQNFAGELKTLSSNRTVHFSETIRPPSRSRLIV
jgi:hypothetical protein